MIPYPVNQRLIAGAQATLAQAPLSDFLYSRLKLDALVYSEADIILTSRFGIGFEKVFRRKSGASLSDPISVLFTKDGFSKLYPRLSTQLITEAGKENWVLGREDAGLTIREIANIETELRDQYTRDYISTWRRLLLDLEIVPFASETSARETLSLITARPSVMQEFLGLLAKNTALTKASPDGPGGGDDEPASRLSRIFGDTPSPADALAAMNPGDPIAREFASVNRLVVGEPGQPTAMDSLLLLVADLELELEASGDDALQRAVAGGGPAARKIRTEARRQPEPIRSWLVQLSGGSQALVASNARSELSARYEDSVLLECRRLIAGRYPFEKNSRNDVALDDFGRIFGYGGVLDSFFQDNLAALVDRSGNQWRMKSGGSLRISTATLQRFRHAEQIRESFFRPGSQQPDVTLTLTPIRLDADVSRFVFEVDGQSFDYRHGPQREWNVKWPGEGLGMARIMFEERSGGRPTVVEEGPWALFRLFDGSNITAQSQIQFELDLIAGGRTAKVRAQARSVRNVLSRRDLHNFQCPDRL